MANWLSGDQEASFAEFFPSLPTGSQRPRNLIKLSDFVKERTDLVEDERQKLRATDKPFSERGVLQRVGNRLRRCKESHWLALRALQTADQLPFDKGIRGVVIDGIRNPGEIEALSNFARFFLLAIDAPFTVRWERLRNDYDGNLQMFEEDDERDRNEVEEWGQKVQRCVDMADAKYRNSKSFSEAPPQRELEKQLTQLLDLMERPGSRDPTEDEVGMNHAYVESCRSRCLRRTVGAVVFGRAPSAAAPRPLVAGGDNEVRSPTVGAARPLVAGGYNEVPNPTVDLPCRYKFEECYREHEMRSSAGTRSQGRPPCRAVHAEQRAILSAKEHIGDLSGCILYTTTFPCDDCARMTVLTKISEVVFAEPYPSDEIDSVLANNSVTVRPFEGVKGPAFLKLFGRLSVTVHALAEAHR